LNRKPIVTAVAALSLAAICAWAAVAATEKPKAEAKPASGANVVAEVAGQPVTMEELEKSLAGQLAELEKQRHEMLEKGVQSLVEEKLLEHEAVARGVTKEALIKSEITDKVTVSDADVDSFYEQNKARMPPNTTKEQISPRIKQYLQGDKGMKARAEFVAALRTKYAVRILFEPQRIQVAATGPAKGPAGAPVTIVEFSDFQCPYCSRVKPAIDQIVSTYGDKVRIVFRHYPLPIHPFAPKAAEAAICADDQGKFWAMHDALFANQNEATLGVEGLKKTAAGLGLDATKFNTCLDSGANAAKVQADLAAGNAVGVNGTPAFFVNGRSISGAQPFEQFKQLIDDELARKAAPKPTK